MFLFAISCKEECKSGEDRCQGEIIQLCNSDGEWYNVQNCVDVIPGLWECCEDAFEYDSEELSTCVPIDTCESDGGTDP